MANASHTLPKRERRRIKAEQLRAAQHRREQRRTIGFTLGAIAVIGIVVAVFVSLSGEGGSSGGTIRPSAANQVSTSGAPRSSMLSVGEKVPDFSAPGFHMQAKGGGGYTIARTAFDWSTYGGRPAVLSIWAPWCPHCQNELPVLSEAVAKTPNVRLVTVVTMIGAHPGPTPNGYLADHGLTFPVAIDDATGTLGAALGVQAFPTLYLVDSTGTVRFAHEGEVPAAQLEGELSKLS
jgi:thiol-disulfide isomerase/thioredoxin